MAIKSVTRAVQTFPRATYQDVLNAPPHRVAEVIKGTLHLNPGPAPGHIWASTILGECNGLLSIGVTTDREAGA